MLGLQRAVGDSMLLVPQREIGLGSLGLIGEARFDCDFSDRKP
jgi:hypothetical protein